MQLQRLTNDGPVMLGAEIGRGGEGAVFEIADQPGMVAKIYHKAPTPAKLEKLSAMVRHSTPELLRAAAWPVDLLRDESGATCGFLMPRIAARFDVHELYSPKSRKRRFPKADFRFVVHAATNLSRAFALVHAAGHVIGDVNHGNALIGDDATVVLIDCDSFQVHGQDAVYSCDVGSPLFTPPELCGRSFRGLRRDAAHDAFGLAVLLFHLLYLGRHPFAGHGTSGDMPIEQAIAEARFAYGAGAAAFGVSRPPRTLPLATFGEGIATLFERAFASPGVARRPGAVEWVESLHELERRLKPCASSSAHFHLAAATCCWCEIEERSGMRAYGTAADETIAAVVRRLWERIARVPRPPPDPPTPSLPASDLPAEVLEDVKSRYLQRALALLGAVGVGVLFVPMTYGLLTGGAGLLGGGALLMHYRSRAARLRAAGDALDHELAAWMKSCSDEPFTACLAGLESTRRELLAVAAERERHQLELPMRIAESQRQQYLDEWRIRDAHLPGFHKQVLDMLASYGVEDADDVLRMPETVERLLGTDAAHALQSWAENCSRQFDAASYGPIPPPAHEQQRDHALRRRESKLLSILRDGADILQREYDQLMQRRGRAEERYIDARRAFMRLRAELRS